MLTPTELETLVKAVTFLDDATDLIEDEGGDEDDITQAREVAMAARETLKKLGATFKDGRDCVDSP